jgi:hypothetical protein
MPAPAKPQYAPITRATLNRLLGEFTPLKQAYDQATQAAQGQQGGWNRSIPTNVSQDYQDKIREIERCIRQDIDAVDQMCNTHAQYIQSLLDKAKVDLQMAKKTVGVFDSDPNEQNAAQASQITSYCAVALEKIAVDAAEADKAYGQAWFPYRSDLTLPDPNINQDYFLTQRQAIISRGKTIAAKVAKCEQLEEQAKAMRAMSIKFLEKSKGLKAQKAEIKKTATELEAKLAKLYNDGINNRDKLGWQNDGRNWKSRERAIAGMAQKTITKKIQSEAASWMTELEAILKIYRNQVKTMETVYAAAVKPLTPKELKKEQKLFDQAAAHVAEAQATYKAAEKIVVEARKDADRIKQTKVV